MNIKSYIGAMIICIIGLTSCEDRLDLKPFDELETDIALNTPSDFENLMKGAYIRMLGVTGEFIIRPDIMSDNLIINQQGRQTNDNLYRLEQTNSSATWSTPASSGADAAYICNLLLENVDKLFDQDYADELRGEAMAVRAWVHFDAARVYCKAPITGSDSDLGWFYRKDTDINVLPSRGNLGDLYANILADLNMAVTLLPDDNGVGRINKYTVYGLLSRVLLYTGDWAGARDAAQVVMNQGPYNVTPRESFASVWSNQYEQSVLLKLLVVNADDFAIGTAYGQAVVGPEFVPDFGFFQMYGTDDIRKGAYFEDESVDGLTYNTIIKYKSRPDSPLNTVDPTLLRMDEVVLNLAEAQANISGGDAAALTALDMIRSERYAGFVSGGETGTALMDAIKRERRLELAFEGHRSFDLKRWGEGFTRTSAGEFSNGVGGTLPPASAMSLSAGDHRFEWPINQASININENLEQNPGY